MTQCLKQNYSEFCLHGADGNDVSVAPWKQSWIKQSMIKVRPSQAKCVELELKEKNQLK